jgi:hypothetical protein
MTVKVDGSNGLLANYDFQTPTTGFSYTFTTFNVLFTNPAGTLATGTVTMSATPVDGTTVTITSTQQITALTINANAGQSIVGGGAVQLNANTSRQYLYRSANTTWYLINVAAGAVVTSAVAGTGVSVSSATGAVTITNTGVTSAAAGNGIAVSASTGGVTISQDFYSGTSTTNSTYPVSSYVVAYYVGGTNPAVNNSGSTLQVQTSAASGYFYLFATPQAGYATLAGTWRNRGQLSGTCTTFYLMQRVA